jgi:hypothetical protein
MQPEDLRELRDDLRRERQRIENLLATLVRSLSRLGEGPDTVEAAALLLVSRTLNGGTPRQGDGWHRRCFAKAPKRRCRSICASGIWCATSTPMS